jgi:hypothetical protein
MARGGERPMLCKLTLETVIKSGPRKTPLTPSMRKRELEKRSWQRSAGFVLE